jgi:hypothetical protein
VLSFHTVLGFPGVQTLRRYTWPTSILILAADESWIGFHPKRYITIKRYIATPLTFCYRAAP